ncbi:unnamed protein product [Ophioblennius macclurei]
MLHPSLFSVLLLHSVNLQSGDSVPAAGGVPSLTQVERWVRSGLQVLHWDLLDRCLRLASLSESECRRVTHLPNSAVTVYVSEPRGVTAATDKVVAILPESPGGISTLREGFGPPGSTPATAHDAVLVLDPSPGENFGHPVVLFYVDMNVTKRRCSHLDGIYLGDECLTLALKGRCQNQLKRRQSGAERIMGNGGVLRAGGGSGRPWGDGTRPWGGAIGGLCEVHFLPLVVRVGDRNRTQRLRCVDHPAFSPCPRLLPLSSPALPVSSCELNKNTRRCHQQALSSRRSCRLYQTCDHAVLLAGGWRQQTTFQRHAVKLQNFYRMLRANGFHQDHIKTFFAGSGQLPEEVEGVHPATEKEVIRNHISYVCRKQHCADTLVLYLNSPTRSDGTMLLWDANLNGIADPKERYSVTELLADLAGCRASRVLLFMDQSYGGVLSKRLRGSQKHLNAILIQNQDRSWTAIGPTTCLLDHLGQGTAMPRLPEPWAGFLNVTLAGAPCNATALLTDGELRREYQGCQNLPTALWHQNQNQR